jgi:hypothetical protein
MNLIEIAEDLKDVPDQYLMQEIQQPTGNFPAYLVVSELGRRKRMREKVAKEMPTQTVAEELATPPQMPQMGTMMPQGAPQGLMGMPQAQSELAAQDAMGTTPPEMMMPTQQMAGGGMVSFKQGGDVIRAFDGLPEDMFSGTPSAGGMGLPQVIEQDPDRFIPSALMPSTVYFAYMTPEEQAIFERTGVVPESAKQKYMQAQMARSQPVAVAPVAVAPTTPAAAPTAPAAAPAAPPVAQATIPSVAFAPTADLPTPLTAEARQTARTRGMSEYEQAVPDRLTPFFQEAIAKREGEIEGRRGSNINEALIQAGLGIMGSKSPRFLQAASEGGLSALKSYREGAKDIRQSEEALLASRAKMAEAQTLRDDRKFKAAEDAERSARQEYTDALNLATTKNAMDYRNLMGSIAAQKAPYEIAESQARSQAYLNRPAGVDKTIANPDQIAQAKIRALTDLAASGVKSPTPAQIDAATDAILGQSGLRRVMAGLPAVAPAAGETGARFVGFE